MKGLLWVLSAVFIAAGVTLVSMVLTPNPTLESVPVALQIQVRQEVQEEPTVHKVDTQSEQKGTGSCLVWGPFNESTMRGLAQALRESHLNDKAMVTDRFLPQRYIVYLGPLENITAVRAFTKQFKQQGFRQVRPITRGDLSPGIQIGEFATEAQATAYIEAGKVPRVRGIRVVSRLGEPSEEVDLMFKDMSTAQEQRLRQIAKRFTRTKVIPCTEP